MQQALIDSFVERLAREPAVRVVVERTQGSVPREAGAWMGVFANGDSIGSVGGGHLEFDAIAQSRRALAGQAIDLQRRVALGPALGQCCGGVVHLRFEPLQRGQKWPIRNKWTRTKTSSQGSACVANLLMLPS